MKRSLYLIPLLFAGLFYFSSVIAAEDSQVGEPAGATNDEEVIAMCEEKYSAEKIADDVERQKLIDTCIDENADGAKSPPTES